MLDFTMSYMPTSLPYVPFPATSPPLPMSDSMMTSMEIDDPNNGVGRGPKKQKAREVTVRCDVCNLDFFSEAVLDSHIAGSKHQRKVKSADLMKTLQQTEEGFERDDVSGVIRCIVCDVTVNSPQLLATHIAGNKHKQRASKRSGDPTSNPPAKRSCPGGVTGTVTPSVRSSNGGPNASSGGDGPPLDIPECVTKLEETKGGGKYLCNPCQAHCNSEQQLAQHLSSKKHLDKLSGRKPQGGGGGNWRGRRRPAFRGRPGRGRPSHTYTQPLSSNFVAGGALL